MPDESSGGGVRGRADFTGGVREETSRGKGQEVGQDVGTAAGPPGRREGSRAGRVSKEGKVMRPVCPILEDTDHSPQSTPSRRGWQSGLMGTPRGLGAPAPGTGGGGLL